MAQASTTQSLPEAAYALAALYELGTPTARYQHRMRQSDWVIAGIALVTGSFLFFAPSQVINAVGPLRIIAWLLYAACAFVLGEVIMHLLYRRSSVLVCTAGLLRVSGSKHEVVRWEEVESVIQVPALEPGEYLIALNREPACMVRRTDGVKLTCRVGRSQTKQLGEMVARATAPYLLPKALAAYHSGWPVVFGTLRLTQQGISRGDTFLPWSQYQGYLLTEGLLMIWQWGDERWGKLPLRKVSNLHVLTGLLDQIQRGQRESVFSGPIQQI